MFLTTQHRILITLLEHGPLQNSQIAKRVGITEQWCSEMVNALHAEGLIESEFKHPRRISKLTERGVEIAKHLKEIGENIINKQA
ncbi:MAG: winged helix-turn-helix transcriptional regulator [Candidatus Bathyarchaeia archaeon]|nr:winged helix-turn-helix transcriptional regulator [Candidatus Bathyarchaeia archaeon]